jgi:hypothetical protein
MPTATLISTYIFLLFFDEVMRKAAGSGGIVFTLLKDLLLIVVAVLVYKHARCRKSIAIPLVAVFVLNILSSLAVYFTYYDIEHFYASTKVYIVIVSAAVFGSFISRSKFHRELFFKRYLQFLFLTNVVCILQEYLRASLPSFLAQNTFIDAHSGSVGLYVEGTFSSPQTLSVIACFGILVLVHLPRNIFQSKLFFYLLMVTTLHTIYVSRIRFTFVALTIIGVIAIARWLLRPKAKKSTIVLTTFLFASVVLTQVITNLKVETEFVGKSFEVDAILFRLENAFFVSYTDVNPLFGYGAGTTGRLGALLQAQGLGFIPVFDSGYSQIATQYGITGSLLFGSLVASSYFLALSRLLRSSGRNLTQFSSLSSLLLLFILSFWYLKQYTIGINGATGFVLGLAFGMIGTRPQE